jgi:hypothetical protein
VKSVEQTVRAATRAYGQTVHDIRPLELSPAPAERAEPVVLLGPGPGGRPPRRRHVPGWIAPVAAAVAVIAVASSVVLARDLPGTGHAASAEAAAASALPGYYVLLDQPRQKAPALRDVRIGDSFTGKTVATIAPPAGSTFTGVTAAADDRTFIVDTMTTARNADLPLAITWYLLRITPGAGPGYRLTRLSVPDMSTWAVQGIALSSSGTELALALVASGGGAGTPRDELRIYSVATAKLLHYWSSGNPGEWGPVITSPGLQDLPLYWADNDRALAFGVGSGQRLLNVAAPGHNLTADSKPGWPSGADGPGCVLSSGGKTTVCLVEAISKAHDVSDDVLRWVAYSASGAARTLYQVTAKVPGNDDTMANISWVSPSGQTAIVNWAIAPAITPSDTHFGAVSDGKLIPLRVSSSLFSPADWPTIAW